MIERVRSTRFPIERKDLTHDLQERLTLLEAEEREAAAKLEGIREQRILTAKLLDIERKANGSLRPAPRQHPKRTVTELVHQALWGASVVSKASIVDAAITEGHESPARAVNMVLMGLLRRDLVTRTKNDEDYSLTLEGRAALSQIAEGAQ